MCARTVSANVIRVLIWGLHVTAGAAVAEQAAVYSTPGEVPLCLSPVHSTNPDGQVLVGYSTGRLIRLSFTGTQPRATWEAKVDGGVLAVLDSSPLKTDGRAVVTGTATGHVVCFRDDKTEPAWRFQSTCEVSCLAELPDVNGDGTTEIVVSGADQRVHLLDGKTGKVVWTHHFKSTDGVAYVSKLLVGPDQNRDGMPEIVTRMWGGELAVLSGRSGEEIWRKKYDDGFMDGLAIAKDLNSDGDGEFVIVANDGIVRTCSGRDGAVLWSGRVDRSLRDVTVAESAVYTCSASGVVARFLPRTQDSPAKSDEPQWTVNLGDVCRAVIVTADVDHDGEADVAACAENGVVALLSGKTGKVLRRWQFGDVVRTIWPVSTGDRHYIAAAGLDAAVRLLPVAVGETDLPPVPVAASQPNREPTPIAKTVGEGTKPRVLILLYHDILPEEFNHYATSVERFRTHMDTLIREKYVCVTLDQIADWIEGKGGMPERAVCITFDGQYQGQYTYAWPILRERKMFATSYITTDWIGTANHCDWHQIRELEASGVMDIQNHTINHPFLTRRDRAEVIRQLEICNEAIRRHMNGKISRHHTYPAGAFNDAVRQIVRECGFRTATTVLAGPVPPNKDLMILPRYMLCTHKTQEQFEGWLHNVNTTPIDRAGP